MRESNEYYKALMGVMVAFIIGLIFLLILITSCTKEHLFDPNCGVISYNQKVNDTWVVGYKWNDGTTDTIVWHFDIVSRPGDTICKLLPVDLDELNCDRP